MITVWSKPWVSFVCHVTSNHNTFYFVLQLSFRFVQNNIEINTVCFRGAFVQNIFGSLTLHFKCVYCGPWSFKTVNLWHVDLALPLAFSFTYVSVVKRAWREHHYSHSCCAAGSITYSLQWASWQSPCSKGKLSKILWEGLWFSSFKWTKKRTVWWVPFSETRLSHVFTCVLLTEAACY